MQTDFDIFIPSYHRSDNCKTANYFVKYVGWEPSKITIFIDSEADDRAEYEALVHRLGCKLHVFDMYEARARYDYVHRASVSRRSAGQARNMMQEYAIANGIGFYMVQDDDTQCYTTRWCNMVGKKAKPECVRQSFYLIREFMERQRIGLFGTSQSGDLIGGCTSNAIYRKKVMNTTFYLMPYIVRGERGVQDDDTSLFTGVMNAGLFTGSVRYGLILHQMQSAKQAGGLTDLYNECKLLNKSLVCPIQFPSAIYAERQAKNGARLHHHIQAKYLFPCIIKKDGARGNIAWDAYPEDTPFTNEPKRNYVLK